MGDAPDIREQEDCPGGAICDFACDQHEGLRNLDVETLLDEFSLLVGELEEECDLQEDEQRRKQVWGSIVSTRRIREQIADIPADLLTALRARHEENCS